MIFPKCGQRTHPLCRGGLTGPKLLEGDCWEKGGDFFQGVQFSHKNKLKSEIFNDKKSL